MAEIDDDRLRVYIVWMPMLRSDSHIEAVAATAEFADARLSYYWDEQRITGQAWAEVIGLESTAWDVYFLYDSEAGWSDRPGDPSFWMHQLGGNLAAPLLDYDCLVQATVNLLQ